MVFLAFDRQAMELKRRLLLLTTIGLLATSGCGTLQQQMQPATATLAPIVSMTPRFTATPVASRTPLPTFTYTPSESPVPPTPSNTPTPTEVPPLIGIISSQQTVNVREGPGTSFRPINSLPAGTRVEVLGMSEDELWMNILMEDGDEGWVSARLVFLQATATPFPTMTPSPDLTALALGTPLPTALLGGGTVTPTPPSAAVTPTPVGDAGAAVIDLSAFNQTATALVGSITGGATSVADSGGAPVGGPTGGPISGTPTPAPGQGAQGSASSQEGVDVLAYCDKIGLRPPATLQAGATIDVYWSWYAKEPSQLADHIAHVIYEVTVDGNRLQNWRQYAAQQRQESDGNWYQYWFVPYGPLSAGEHVIEYRVTWREAISDGYQRFGPGTATTQETGSCRFTVR